MSGANVAVGRCEQLVRKRLVERDLRHLEPANRLSHCARLEAEHDPTLAVDGERERIGAVWEEIGRPGAARPRRGGDRDRRPARRHRLARELEVEARQERGGIEELVADRPHRLRLVLDHAALGRREPGPRAVVDQRHRLTLLAKAAVGVEPRPRRGGDRSPGVGLRFPLEPERALVGVLLAIEVRPVVHRQPRRPPARSGEIEELEKVA